MPTQCRCCCREMPTLISLVLIHHRACSLQHTMVRRSTVLTSLTYSYLILVLLAHSIQSNPIQSSMQSNHQCNHLCNPIINHQCNQSKCRSLGSCSSPRYQWRKRQLCWTTPRHGIDVGVCYQVRQSPTTHPIAPRCQGASEWFCVSECHTALLCSSSTRRECRQALT